MGRFQRAKKEQAKLRLGLQGPAGSGKTYTGLEIATGIAEKTGAKIAGIDSERGSMAKYADRFTFDTIELDIKTVDEYIAAMHDAANEGYGVLVIDSVSHAWDELKAEVDLIAKTKYRNNSWAAWSEGTPKQKAFIAAMMDYPGHVIVTMRVRTEWLEGERNSKKTYERVGTKAEQREGFEYEVDMLGLIDTDHNLSFAKDRTGKFQDKIIPKASRKLGHELIAWLSDGAAPVERRRKPEPEPQPEPEPATKPQARPAKKKDSWKELPIEKFLGQFATKSAGEWAKRWEAKGVSAEDAGNPLSADDAAILLLDKLIEAEKLPEPATDNPSAADVREMIEPEWRKDPTGIVDLLLAIRDERWSEWTRAIEGEDDPDEAEPQPQAEPQADAATTAPTNETPGGETA